MAVKGEPQGELYLLQGPVPEVRGMEVGRERQDDQRDVVKQQTQCRQDVQGQQGDSKKRRTLEHSG